MIILTLIGMILLNKIGDYIGCDRWLFVIIVIAMEVNQLRTNIVNILNQTRNDPKAAAEQFYQTLAPQFRDEELWCWNKCIETFEGIEALEDLKSTLKNSPNA